MTMRATKRKSAGRHAAVLAAATWPGLMGRPRLRLRVAIAVAVKRLAADMERDMLASLKREYAALGERLTRERDN